VLRAKPSDLTHGFPPGGAAPLCNLLAADGFEFVDQLLQMNINLAQANK